MRRFVVLLILTLGLSAPLSAQDTSEADKTFLENLLEETLSDAGRNVTVTGFEGALSSNATLDTLTIADEDGIWFTMRDASLEWSRLALLAGRLDVTELTAAEITLSRLPKGQEGLNTDDAEAWQFSLPELPVSVQIDLVRAADITLESAVLGEAVSLSLDGNVSLADGEGAAALDIRRKDRNDKLSFDGAFSNETRVLKFDLDFQEARDGLVSTLLRIPESPALRLQVTGEAPLSDFSARIALSSDGQRRFGGALTIAALDDEIAQGYAFSADLNGDVRPLFSPDLRPFFGDSAELIVSGQTRTSGRLILDELKIASEALQAEGKLTLSASGWPETLQLQGRIGGEGDVRLPMSGPPTTLRRAEISASYDAAQDDQWQAEATVVGLSRGDLRLDRARFGGTGQITRAPDQSLTADLSFETQGLMLEDDALARAIGPAPSGTLELVWQPGQPLVFKSLSVESGNVALNAEGRIESLRDGFPVTGRATVSSTDLSRFAALADRDLAGTANATIEGTGTLLGGAFDIELDAETTDLEVGEPRLDPLMTGRGTLSLDARRDTEGTQLEDLAIQTQALSANASGRLDADDGQLDIEARLEDIAQVEPRLSGPATLDTAFTWQSGDALTVSRFEATAAGATLSATGALYPENPQLPAEGELTLTADDLSRLARLTGRPLAGRLRMTLDGSGEISGRTIDLSTDLKGSNLRTGLAELDRLIAGSVEATASVALDEEHVDIRYVNIDTPRLRADAEGRGPGAPVDVSARIADLAVLLPGFGGAATAQGTVILDDRTGRDLTIALDASGPGGTTARVTGTIRDYGNSLALDTSGTAPLGLANRFISPRSIAGLANFDLSIDGPPRLSSLSGAVTIADGRLSLPRFSTALTGLAGTLRLASGRVETDITGSAGTGGGFRLRGPITLEPPFNATLQATLTDLGIADPNLYRTDLSGTVEIDGPLTGGARISGTVNLGRTELRVPSGSGTRTPGDIADITHLNEPAAVRQTRRRAGLLGQDARQIIAYPLDLTINAPNRIFVRGRGLDAELGGQLRLGGTTANVVPSGIFELIRGRLDILGRRILLTEGLIDLRGALDPYLRFVAETENDDITVRVILEGLASEPSVRFESVPDLPQDEAVARLLFGRGLDSISPFQAAQLVAAAATLSGQRSGGLTGDLRSAFSLSDFDVTSTDDGATQVRAGAYLSEKVYSEVTADSEGNQEINLKLDLTPSVTVKGTTNTEGNTGVGIFFEKDY